MKKKFLSVLTCLALILVCLFVATGCNEIPDTNIYVSTAQELTTAVANAEEDAVIVVTKDLVLTEQLDVTKKITLNLNGKKLYTEVDIVNNDPNVKAWSMISVKEGGDLTITGNGTIEALANTECYGIDVRGGNLIFKEGTIKANCSAVYVREGSATIEGGTIEVYPDTYDQRYTLNCLDANLRNGTATIVVKGGTFVNYNPAASASENPLKKFVADGYQSVAEGNNFIVSKIAE